MTKQIESEVTQDSQIVIGMSDANTRLIFPKRNVQHPMDAVFNTPMTSDGGSKAFDIFSKTQQILAGFAADLKANASLRLHHANRLQTLPLAFRIQVLETSRIINEPMFADF